MLSPIHKTIIPKRKGEKVYVNLNVLGHSAEQGSNNKEQPVRVKLIGYQSLSKSTHPLKSAESASRPSISLVRRGQNKSQRLCQIEVLEINRNKRGQILGIQGQSQAPHTKRIK